MFKHVAALQPIAHRPGVPVPAIVQHGISEQQSRVYAEHFTSGVNKLLGTPVIPDDNLYQLHKGT